MRDLAVAKPRLENFPLGIPGEGGDELDRARHLEGGHVPPAVVQECAVAAATEDPRFPPVSPDELSSLRVEISVLTPLVLIRPEEVEVGRHGLMIAQGRRRGLLLPQVPVEWGWDRETFLDQTCVKAGLPPSAWRHGATLWAFTAEVFGEEEPAA